MKLGDRFVKRLLGGEGKGEGLSNQITDVNHLCTLKKVIQVFRWDHPPSDSHPTPWLIITVNSTFR